MQSPAFLVAVVFALVVILVFLGVMFTGFSGGVASSVLAPVCAVLLIIAVVAVLVGTQGMYRSRIPPPPPIQQPMVPAGTRGPVELSCPNCGAPPTVVDRFGVATCTYCNTRFLVR
jgi:hypothetical protein